LEQRVKQKSKTANKILADEKNRIHHPGRASYGPQSIEYWPAQSAEAIRSISAFWLAAGLHYQDCCY
jgi:hypothetical protein